MATAYITAPRATAEDIATALVEEPHLHELPCIERFDEDVWEAFADWRAGAVRQ